LNSENDHLDLDWRRSKVLELSSQGHSEREMAKILQVAKTTVHKDLVYLRKQAQDSLQYHLTEVIPHEYQKAMTGMKLNLKQTLEIA
jgi:transposase